MVLLVVLNQMGQNIQHKNHTDGICLRWYEVQQEVAYSKILEVTKTSHALFYFV